MSGRMRVFVLGAMSVLSTVIVGVSFAWACTDSTFGAPATPPPLSGSATPPPTGVPSGAGSTSPLPPATASPATATGAAATASSATASHRSLRRRAEP